MFNSAFDAHRYLTGDQLTEADLRLWTTLVHFDPVYVTHFKFDRHRIGDFINLSGFLHDIYQMPGIAETVNLPHIRHYYLQSQDHQPERRHFARTDV